MIYEYFTFLIVSSENVKSELKLKEKIDWWIVNFNKQPEDWVCRVEVKLENMDELQTLKESWKCKL